ncbi:hypothetical protein [Streptomyces sp. NBC_00268]|uniref:hypothetical protein n=1 Tax=Streptomyces sp. NBC_00268 TaxID=2975695 RepID=UPI00224D35F4|nr:hypothetical protein [Streptomyces sp. NBC_00268]MCX5182573.1 hypothetical protein [Streptomyces sp. NBC_00268]
MNGARRVPELAAAFAETEVKVGAFFKKGLSMREIIRRAQLLEREQGPAARPPAGAAMAGHAGRAVTAKYRSRSHTIRGHLVAGGLTDLGLDEATQKVGRPARHENDGVSNASAMTTRTPASSLCCRTENG